MNENELVHILLKDEMKTAIKKLGYKRSLKTIENIANPVLRAMMRQSLNSLWNKIEVL